MRRDEPRCWTQFARRSAWLFVLTTAPALLRAQVDCGLPGRNTPAVPVPECVNATGDTVTCTTPGSIRLWADDFRPASQIPPIRDSTDRVAGKTVPGMKSGHELFSTVDIVTVAGVSRRLYVAYNAGIQAWDILADAANPVRLDVRDGWEGHFLSFPAPGEVLTWVLDISAMNAGANADVVAVSGNDGVGPTLWEFNTTTGQPTSNQFRPLYQDTATDSKMVKLIQRNDGTFFAFAAAVSDGLVVYNVSAARSLSPPCLDSQGSNCPTVYRGRVTDGINQPTTPNYVDAIHISSSDKVFVAVAGGLSTNLDIWQLSNPQFPGTAVRKFSGFKHSQGTALFKYESHYYLAVVVDVTDDKPTQTNNERLRIFMIDGCLNSLGLCSVGPGSIEEAVRPMEVAPGFPTSKDFITYSEFNGDPYLYYSAGTGNLSGPDLDQIFDASGLRPPNGNPLASLPSITQSGGSYIDPCNGSQIRYWSHYYHANAHGLNNMTPRHGKFSEAGYFYRTAGSILDVHVKGAGAAPGPSNIRTAVVNPQPFHWMSDPIAFTATVTGDCTPSSLSWQWQAVPSSAQVAATEIFQLTTNATYSFDCVALGRCAPATATVQAANEACLDAVPTAAGVSLKDPTIAVVSTSTGGRSTFERCEIVPLSANLVGRAPAYWEWRIDGTPIEGCSSSLLSGDLEEAGVACFLEGSSVLTENVFFDDFETGDASRWSLSQGGVASVLGRGLVQKASEVLTNVDLMVWNTADTSLGPRATGQAEFSLAATGTPAFDGAPTETVDGPGATLDHPAVNATTWTWDIEDPLGEDLCSFPGKTSVNCVIETTTDSSLTHFWPQAGTYSYRVTISNCGEITATRTDEVTVESGVLPDITSFEIRNFASSGCTLDLNNGGQYCCPTNTDIEFVVKLAEPGTFSFSFDWQRSSSAGTPNWTSETPTGKDPALPHWFFKHRFTTSTVFPIARASSGLLEDSMAFLNGRSITGGCGAVN